MAELIVKTKDIVANIQKLSAYLKENDIEWTLVTKVLSGNKEVLEKILIPEALEDVQSVADSRLSNLKTIKLINPDIRTMYIKPPAIQSIKTVVSVADISLNSSIETIEALNKEAKRQGKIHKVIIMMEMGELREGVIRDGVIEFYERSFNLSNIEVIGLGTNLGCMYGIEPTYDKLIQLSLYKKLIECMFKKQLPLISGGSSITLPIIKRKKVPNLINHFRIGESVFLGLSPLNNKKFRNLSTTAFDFNAHIIEMEEKENKPDGILTEGNVGHTSEIEGADEYAKSYRAILDFGALDVDPEGLTPKDKNVNFFGTTSDMTVYDLGVNITKSAKIKYKVGNSIHFNLDYMSVARLMSSKFITKKVI